MSKMKPEDYLRGTACRFGIMGAAEGKGREYGDFYFCNVPATSAWWAEHHTVATPLCDKHLEQTSRWYKAKNPTERQFSELIEVLREAMT